ncbi:proline-rich receptor-like protein kinase PERK2 [Iris pallida]|uniref:Proline-rich receptor-like protein kinase PERK2 n=1 Tax=Iris pallida TaxID=29817 RepID=A0AAX6H0J9_IRIPA|nr:proline-rich receptor-like protein kinase PERK2 [Iris pallida]KAJ6834322.1 proline-rich receptor-like protein kinase PERK2 [Iris pallida]
MINLISHRFKSLSKSIIRSRYSNLPNFCIYLKYEYKEERWISRSLSISFPITNKHKNFKSILHQRAYLTTMPSQPPPVSTTIITTATIVSSLGSDPGRSCLCPHPVLSFRSANQTHHESNPSDTIQIQREFNKIKPSPT